MKAFPRKETRITPDGTTAHIVGESFDRDGVWDVYKDANGNLWSMDPDYPEELCRCDFGESN